MKSRPKPSTRSRVDDESDDEVPAANRSPKKWNSSRDDEEEEQEETEETSSKRKKNNHAVDDNKPATGKNSKASSKNEPAKKDASERCCGPKPLPPKRQPIVTEEVEQNKLNLESLKYLGIAAAVIGVICGIGWLIYSWSAQLPDKVPVAHVDVPQEHGGNNSSAAEEGERPRRFKFCGCERRRPAESRDR